MKKVCCPSCGQQEGVPLIWGAVDEERWKMAQRGDAVLAGCMMQPAGGGVPDHACLQCAHRWIDLEDGSPSMQ